MKRTATTRLSVGIVAGLLALTACASDGDDAAETTEAPVETEASSEEIESFAQQLKQGGINNLILPPVFLENLHETITR